MTLEEALSAYTLAVVNRCDTDAISQAQADLISSIHETFATRTSTVTTTTTEQVPA